MTRRKKSPVSVVLALTTNRAKNMSNYKKILLAKIFKRKNKRESNFLKEMTVEFKTEVS
jgi:hypothetical protein